MYEIYVTSHPRWHGLLSSSCLRYSGQNLKEICDPPSPWRCQIMYPTPLEISTSTNYWPLDLKSRGHKHNGEPDPYIQKTDRNNTPKHGLYGTCLFSLWGTGSPGKRFCRLKIYFSCTSFMRQIHWTLDLRHSVDPCPSTPIHAVGREREMYSITCSRALIICSLPGNHRVLVNSHSQQLAQIIGCTSVTTHPNGYIQGRRRALEVNSWYPLPGPGQRVATWMCSYRYNIAASFSQSPICTSCWKSWPQKYY